MRESGLYYNCMRFGICNTSIPIFDIKFYSSQVSSTSIRYREYFTVTGTGTKKILYSKRLLRLLTENKRVERISNS